MEPGSEKGQTTVVLAIVSMAVLMLCAVLVDAARIKSGKDIAVAAVKSSAISVLSSYNTPVKENYGLFALSPRKLSTMEQALENYISSSLNPHNGLNVKGALRLYDFKVERIEIEPLYGLADSEAVRKQILEYMKYRAPGEIAVEFIRKLELIKNSSDISKAYGEKIKIDALMGDFDILINDLKKSIHGYGDIKKSFVNGYNANGGRKKTIRAVAGYIIDRRNAISSLDQISSEIYAAKKKISGLKSRKDKLGQNIKELSEKLDLIKSEDYTPEEGVAESPVIELLKKSIAKEESELEDVKLKIAGCKSELEGLEDEASALKGDETKLNKLLESAWKRLYRIDTLPYLNLNNEALNKISRIMDISKEAAEDVSYIKSFIKDKLANNDGQVLAFKKSIGKDLSNVENFISESGKLGKIIKQLEKNVRVIERQLSIIEELDGSIKKFHNIPGTYNEIIDRLSSNQEDYSNGVKLEYENIGGNQESGNDKRKTIVGQVKDMFEKPFLFYNDFEKAGIDISKLPSVSGGNMDETGVSPGSNIHEDIEFDEKNRGNFSIKAMDLLAGFTNYLGEGIEDFRDEIYINEYILNRFKNTSNSSNITAFKTFFDSEVEYILHGKSSEKANCLLTRGELLLARFGLNSIHVYTDPKKKAHAAGIAAAVAGWWTGGAGVPIISNLIICSWAMGESVVDVRLLLKGNEVPVYKLPGDWKLEIGLKELKGAAKSNIAFTYEDYLRLFLLMVGTNNKIGRIKDLIQINLNQNGVNGKLFEYNTLFRIKADISVNYLFAGTKLLPGIENDMGRAVYEIEIIEGY